MINFKSGKWNILHHVNVILTFMAVHLPWGQRELAVTLKTKQNQMVSGADIKAVNVRRILTCTNVHCKVLS